MPKKTWTFPDVVGFGPTNTMEFKAYVDDDTLGPAAATTLHVDVTRPLGQTPELTVVFTVIIPLPGNAATVDGGPIAIMPAATIEPGETQEYIFNILNTGATNPVSYLLLIGLVWATGGGVGFHVVPGPTP